MKVLTVVGARPQFIKAGAVARAFAAAGVEEVIVHTGQHYDDAMSGSFFRELEIPEPKVNLEIHAGGHGMQTGRMMEGLEATIVDEAPDWVLVYGDTNSTLAGALVAAKLHVPLAHVEAGLRSFDRKMPEEVNRVLTDHVSDVLFAPTQEAVRNLMAEGIMGEKVVTSGDVMFDVARHFSARAKASSAILDSLSVKPGGFVLATVHRAENTNDGDRLRVIFGALVRVSESMPVVLPMHPRTRAALGREGILDEVESKIKVTGPLGYLDMLMLMNSAAVVATDSGGVQKEAYFQSTPCVTMRDSTEWVELVASGWNRIAAPIDVDNVAESILAAVGTSGSPIYEYGEGRASELIVQVLQDRKA